MGTRGYLSGLTGAAVDPSLLPYRVASVPPEQWDFFHEFILTDEISRCASGGVVWNLLGGFGIGLPPVVLFGSDELKKKVLPGILAGDKRICLAITEPDAGSDVGAISCDAKLTEDGKHFIVNGEKKWITNGIYSDYFTTAVRTGGKGMDGISVLLIERGPGVTTRKMETQGMSTSGSTYVTFEDVKVPVENLLGKKDKGFKGEHLFTIFEKVEKVLKLLANMITSHHVQLQPRANGYHHPMRPLRSCLLRGIRQVCIQA